MSTIERARGRWHEILPALGIETRYLVNKHGPCPHCGGKDRFRFDDRDGSGSYYCNQCGAGSAITLLRRKHGWSFKEACDEVDRIIGTDAPFRNAPANQRGDGRSHRANLERIIAEANDENLVKHYLRQRGLHVKPSVLLGHPALPYTDNRQFLGRFPAMLAPIIGADGRLQSLHRTYLADVTTRKKVMPPVDTIKGGAVRLFEPTDELAVAEGIETAIAAYELFGLPSWALISTAGMGSWLPPSGVNRLLICGDNDENFAGQTAAYGLAKRLQGSIETVEIAIPDVPGTDWLDTLIVRQKSPA